MYSIGQYKWKIGGTFTLKIFVILQLQFTDRSWLNALRPHYIAEPEMNTAYLINH